MKINNDAAASLQRRIKDKTGRKRAAGGPWLEPWRAAAGPLSSGCTLRDQTHSKSPFLHLCGIRWQEDGHRGAAAADGKSPPRGQIFTYVD